MSYVGIFFIEVTPSPFRSDVFEVQYLQMGALDPVDHVHIDAEEPPITW